MPESEATVPPETELAPAKKKFKWGGGGGAEGRLSMGAEEHQRHSDNSVY